MNCIEINDKYFITQIFVIIILIVAIIIMGGIETLKTSLKEIIVNDDGSVIIIKTSSTTIKEALLEHGIDIREQDHIYPDFGEKIFGEEPSKVYIKRADAVTVYVDGEKLDILTHMTSVKGVLKESSIELGEKDRLEGAGINDLVYPGMNFKIIRVKEDYVIENQPISFSVEKRANQRLEQGVEKVVREGKDGNREFLYKVVYEDDELKSKELVEETIASDPINELIEYGTIAKYTTSRGESFRYKQILDMRSTAYTASFKDTGKHPDHPQFGITYTGAKVKRGIVAVDPRVIPLGTRLYVEGVGKTPDYGYALAADIGGAVKGDIIDLYVDTQSEADNWGIKKVKVYILTD